jgi:prefoldin subunit 5
MIEDIEMRVKVEGQWFDLQKGEGYQVLSLRRIERAVAHITAQMDHVVRSIRKLTLKESNQMAKIEDVIAIITPLKSRVEGLNALMDSMRQQIKELLAGEIVPPTLQAKIDNIFLEAKGLSDEIQVAIDENAPPVEPPPVDPPPVDPPVDGQV